MEFANFYKETFVEKHDHKKIKNDLKTFQTLACIKQQRSNGDITTLSAVTYQMINNKEAFIHWIAVLNKNYNGNIRSCRRLGFGELMLTTLLKACSINEMKNILHCTCSWTRVIKQHLIFTQNLALYMQSIQMICRIKSSI